MSQSIKGQAKVKQLHMFTSIFDLNNEIAITIFITFSREYLPKNLYFYWLANVGEICIEVYSIDYKQTRAKTGAALQTPLSLIHLKCVNIDPT